MNQEKSVLTPSQRISFIGLTLDSVSLRAHLSAMRVKAFFVCLCLLCRGKVGNLHDVPAVAGADASVIMAIPLGRSYMRVFQHWVASLSSQTPLCESFDGMCGSTLSVETPWIFDTGGSSGTCPDRRGAHNRCATAGTHP